MLLCVQKREKKREAENQHIKQTDKEFDIF